MAARRSLALAFFTILGVAAVAIPRASAGPFALGDAGNYAILYEGSGHTLQITNVTVNGNIGVGSGVKQVNDSGPSTVNGAINVVGTAISTPVNNNNGANVIGGTNFGVATVTADLGTVNSLNTALGGEAGTNVSIGTGNGQTLTINANQGVLDASGNVVFNVTGFNTTNGETLTINGDGLGDNVVLNFIGLSANFNNQVVLSGGLTDNQVMYNFVGGSNLTGGPTLQINNNASSNLGTVYGIFLDPNGSISITNALVSGHVYGGGASDFQDVSGSVLDTPVATPEPSSLLLLCFGLGLIALLRRRIA